MKNERLSVAAELRRIADIIVTRPVLSYWPHMQASLHATVLREVAAEIERNASMKDAGLTK